MALHSQIDSHKIHDGYLYKKGVYNTSWKRRYFVIYDDRTMDYFKDRSHSTKRNKAKGTIFLTQIKRVELVEYEEGNGSNNCTFIIKENETDNENSNGVNGWSAVHDNNVIISSIDPPPQYNHYDAQYLTETEKRFQKQREILTKSLKEYKKKKKVNTQRRTQSDLFYSIIDQSMVSPTSSGVDCELTDDDGSVLNGFPSTYSNGSYSPRSNSLRSLSIASSYMSKRVIANDLKKHSLSRRDEYDAFHVILNDTKLGLICDRRYSFALISSDREWILSAPHSHDLKGWITVCSKLSQGCPLFDGYLNGNKYFVLYSNKVLNCYKDKDMKHIEFDVDLRHILYLKYELSSNLVEIGLSTNDNVLLAASSRIIGNEWYQQIQCLFSDKLLLKIIYDSETINIHIVHCGQNIKHRHIAMYSDYIVIFQNKKQLNSIKTMTFFNKNIFRDYAIKDKCILIPINQNIKVRSASKQNGKYAFLVTNVDGDRKWYFSVKKKEILNKWLTLLDPIKYKHKHKHKRNTKNNHCDIEIDSIFNKESTKQNIINDDFSVSNNTIKSNMSILSSDNTDCDQIKTSYIDI